MSGKVIKKSHKIKKRFQTYVFNELAEGFVFFPCSIPADPRVLVARCSINQHFPKSKCAVILLPLGREDLRKWVEVSLEYQKSFPLQSSPTGFLLVHRKLGINPYPTFCDTCKGNI